MITNALVGAVSTLVLFFLQAKLPLAGLDSALLGTGPVYDGTRCGSRRKNIAVFFRQFLCQNVVGKRSRRAVCLWDDFYRETLSHDPGRFLWGAFVRWPPGSADGCAVKWDDSVGTESNSDIGKFLSVFRGDDRNVNTDGLDHGIKPIGNGKRFCFVVESEQIDRKIYHSVAGIPWPGQKMPCRKIHWCGWAVILI